VSPCTQVIEINCPGTQQINDNALYVVVKLGHKKSKGKDFCLKLPCNPPNGHNVSIKNLTDNEFTVVSDNSQFDGRKCKRHLTAGDSRKFVFIQTVGWVTF
jgi:hypothetical protein